MLARERSRMHWLLKEGVPIAETARRLGRTRQTIYNWLERKDEDEIGACRRPSKLDEFKPYIENRLERFDLPATVLSSEIRAQGYEGGLTILKDFVANVKDRHVQRVVDRFETEPGRQAQIDGAKCGTIEHDGRRRRLSLFVLVLGDSRVIWARFVVSERRPVLLGLLQQAFREIGGVPRERLVDNMKQVVALARTEDQPAVIQKEFKDFADHWGFEVVACPAYWPRAKGKVERAISYIKSSFLEGRSFRDLEDLNAQLQAWLGGVANVRDHGTLRQRPVDRLSLDIDGMLPVGGVGSYPFLETATRRVDHDARLSFRGVRYAVDPAILGSRRGVEVQVEISVDDELRIRYQGRLVGVHRLVPAGSPPQDDPAHAAARRRQRQRPSWARPAGKSPHFDQQRPVAVASWLGVAPLVEQRALATYDVVH